MKLFNSLIILTAVINFAQDVNEDVDLLASLPTQSLDCSLQFDSDFVANNEEVAAAIEALLEDNASEESGARRGGKPCDSSSEETDEEESVAGEETSADEPLLRRALRGRGRGGRRNRDVTLEAGATRPPRGDKPCDSSDSEEDEETDVEDNTLLRRALRGRGRGGRGRGGRRDRDVTLEAGATRPPRGDRPCDSSSDEETDEEEADAEGETATEETDPRRALRGRGRGRGGRRNRDVTLEAGATRPPRGDRPCDSSDETDEETTAEEDPVLRRLLRRGRDSSEAETDEVTEDSAAVEREPCTRRNRGRGRNNRRNKDTTTETPQETEGVARRALKGRRGSRRSRRVEATISNGSIEVAGLTGEVVFGEVNEDLESMPLTITVGETTFACDVEIGRRNKVSCRAISEDNFRLRVKCELPADEE